MLSHLSSPTTGHRDLWTTPPAESRCVLLVQRDTLSCLIPVLQTGSLELSCPSVSDLVFAESPRLLCNIKTFAGLQLCSLLTSTQVRMPRVSYSVILLEHAALPRSAFWFYRRKGVHFQGICGVNVSVASFLSSLHICIVPAVSCILENSCGWRDTTWTSNWCFAALCHCGVMRISSVGVTRVSRGTWLTQCLCSQYCSSDPFWGHRLICKSVTSTSLDPCHWALWQVTFSSNPCSHGSWEELKS